MSEQKEGGRDHRETASLKIKGWLQAPDDVTWYAAVAATMLAVIGLALPWLWIDDYGKPFGLAGLIMYYPSHDDKIYILKTTPLGTLTMVIAPIFAGIFVMANAIKSVFGGPSAGMGLIAALVMVALCGLTGEITDPDRARIGDIAVPHAGLGMSMMGSLASVGVAIWQWRSGRWEGDGEKGFEW